MHGLPRLVLQAPAQHRGPSSRAEARSLKPGAKMPTSCDLLLTNAHILTMDDRFTVHARGALAITGGEIVAVGRIAGDYEPLETIDCKNRVVMPGSSTPTRTRR